jgi:hypothetical protein
VQIFAKDDKVFYLKLILVVAFYLIYQTLPSFIGFNTSFFIIMVTSSLLTIIILNKEDILDFINLDYKYSLYFFMLLIISSIVFPTNHDILEILYYNGIREELFFRFFMVGVFLNYFIDDNKSTNLYFFIILIFTNILFVLSHQVNILQRYYLFVFGVIITVTFLSYGILSAILFHTIHNLYLPEDYPIIFLLSILPLIVNYLQTRSARIAYFGVGAKTKRARTQNLVNELYTNIGIIRDIQNFSSHRFILFKTTNWEIFKEKLLFDDSKLMFKLSSIYNEFIVFNDSMKKCGSIAKVEISLDINRFDYYESIEKRIREVMYIIRNKSEY